MLSAGKFLFGLAGLLLGLFVVGWFVWTTVRKAEDSGRVLFKWIITAVVFAILIGIALSLYRGGIGGAYIVPPVRVGGLAKTAL